MKEVNIGCRVLGGEYKVRMLSELLIHSADNEGCIDNKSVIDGIVAILSETEDLLHDMAEHIEDMQGGSVN